MKKSTFRVLVCEAPNQIIGFDGGIGDLINDRQTTTGMMYGYLFVTFQFK